MGKLDGKVAIVTGAAGGIGSVTAELFVREGARVVLVDRDGASVSAIAARFGDRAHAVEADVASPEGAARYVGAAVSRFGGLDVLFANAGVEGVIAKVVDLPIDAFDRVVAVNLRGAFLGIREAAPVIARRGGGSIVVTSSVAGLVASPGLGAYVATKHAVIGLAKTAAIELAPRGVRVNAVSPGPIDNRMMRSVEDQTSPGRGAEVKDAFLAMIPMGRYGTEAEVARLVLFLASDDASYCTGGVYVIDGGFVAQ
jgi:NAD(P)-dependent dehydrogenase (short-subunit alcohol dehydrogenase family)